MVSMPPEELTARARRLAPRCLIGDVPVDKGSFAEVNERMSTQWRQDIGSCPYRSSPSGTVTLPDRGTLQGVVC